MGTHLGGAPQEAGSQQVKPGGQKPGGIWAQVNVGPQKGSPKGGEQQVVPGGQVILAQGSPTTHRPSWHCWPPGQSVVVYESRVCLGGGIIEGAQRESASEPDNSCPPGTLSQDA